MDERVRYELADGVATITMDDGKANALSTAMLGDIAAAFDRAEADGAPVVLTGRPRLFSAGFDLATLGAGGAATVEMLHAGFTLAHRMLSFPRPVVVAVSGHAIAMGVFLVLSGDHRVGVGGAGFRCHANEVAIGLTMPRAAVEICRQRLTPAAFEQAVGLAVPYGHDDAVAAGFLDAVVDGGDVVSVAQERAAAFGALDSTAFRGTKRRTRAAMLDLLHAAIEADDADLRALL